MTNEHASLEKYISHTLFEMVVKGLRKGYVLEVSWRLNRDWNILTHSSSVFSSTSFSFCWASQPGALRAQPSAENWFSLPRTATTDSKLTELPVAPGYIIVWHPPASCERCICTQFTPFTVKVIPWYLQPDAPIPWLTAGSKVDMLHKKKPKNKICPVGCGCRMHRLHLCKGVWPHPNDTKQSDVEVPGLLSTLSLPLLPCLLWYEMVAPDRNLSMGQIEINYVLRVNWITWHRSFLTSKLRTYAK